MKRVLVFLLIVLFAACGQATRHAVAEQDERRDGVEILSFHAKKRCPTCIAIEELVHEVVVSEFAAQLADGSLTLRVVAIDDETTLADKYGVTWSSLLINRHKDGIETVYDLTRFAFTHARSNPEKFKAGLKAEIEQSLEE